MPTVKIIEVPRVTPPPEDLVLRLSALDAQWITIPLIQRVLLFDDAGGQFPPFASLASSLRVSLAATLARFPPFAGRIVFIPSTGDAAIHCSASDKEGGGVRFVVAEMEDADARKLAGDTGHDVDAFKALVPELAAEALPAEVLAVQVTRLKGGVAVGVAMHHAVVDGRSVWRFLKAWASACRGDMADTAAVTPSFDRAAVPLPPARSSREARCGSTRHICHWYICYSPLGFSIPFAPDCRRPTYRAGQTKQAALQTSRPHGPG
uniref:Uncharacterized protein n=1 Tax=Avena sativa TaxID=4498 RepID=A0ACD5ZUP2_AVESA